MSIETTTTETTARYSSPLTTAVQEAAIAVEDNRRVVESTFHAARRGLGSIEAYRTAYAAHRAAIAAHRAAVDTLDDYCHRARELMIVEYSAAKWTR